jgi:hypothetical protein
MGTRKNTNTKVLYFIAFIVILAAFFLLGGGPWIKGILHANRSLGTANWNWAQILISLSIGFLLGLLVARRR